MPDPEPPLQTGSASRRHTALLISCDRLDPERTHRVAAAQITRRLPSSELFIDHQEVGSRQGRDSISRNHASRPFDCAAFETTRNIICADFAPVRSCKKRADRALAQRAETRAALAFQPQSETRLITPICAGPGPGLPESLLQRAKAFVEMLGPMSVICPLTPLRRVTLPQRPNFIVAKNTHPETSA